MMRSGSGSVMPISFARLGRRSGGAPKEDGTAAGRSAQFSGAGAPQIRTGALPPQAGPERRLLRPGARQETLRETNLALITEEIFASLEPLSRADLAIRTGMTRSTVSRLVDDLLGAGIVREGSPLAGGTRGRPAVPLTPARRTLAGLGVEVSVDFTAARALDLTGAVLAEEIITADHRASDPQKVVLEAGRLALRVAGEATEAGAQIIGTVLAVPGLVARDERSLLLAPNLGWKDVDLVDLLRAAEEEQDSDDAGSFGSFIRAANEAKLAALAVAQELTETDGEEQTFLYVSAQMGIGSAVVIDGVVEAGPHGWGGELGHIAVEPSGPDCSCGSTGCLEVYAGKRALLSAAGLPPGAEASEVLELIEGSEGEQAAAAVEHAGWALGIALAAAMNVLDVHEVVLGGEFGPLTDLLRPGIETQLRGRVLASPWTQFRVRGSAASNAPATTGGALRALRAVVEAPLAWVPEAPAVQA